MKFLLAIVGGFAAGVLMRSLFVFGWPVYVFVGILFVLCAVATFLKPRRASALGGVFFVFLTLGMCRAALADTPLPKSFVQDLKHRVSYEGVVTNDPDLRDANQRIEIAVSYGGASTKVLAVVPRSPEVRVGEQVAVSGTLLVPETFSDDNGRTFRYDKYLERDGVRFMLDFGSVRVLAPAPWYSIPALFARIKHLFLDGLARALPEPYASLAGGIVIGGKSGLGTELQNAFVKSGLVQIIVLSGYNVMIVAEWVMAGLAYARLKRKWSALAGTLAVLVFVGIAGASATALRAMLMAFIALYARATGRSYAAGRALLAVVFLMLLYNPLYLAFDPGFGLSVAATAGLIWLAPPMERWWVHFLRVGQVQRHPTTPLGAAGLSETLSKNVPISAKGSFWTNAVATTCAAQIAVLPLLLYDTGNLSLVALPANLLAMPFVPAAMALSALAGIAGILFSCAPIISIVLGMPAYLATLYLIELAQWSTALPFAAFTLPPFPFWLVVASYAALIWLASSKRFSMTLQLRLAKNASI